MLVNDFLLLHPPASIESYLRTVERDRRKELDALHPGQVRSHGASSPLRQALAPKELTVQRRNRPEQSKQSKKVYEL